jgi:hypothetical protein
MAEMSADFSELVEFATGLNEVPAELVVEVRKVVQKSSLSIKTAMAAQMRASTHFKGAASAISYETSFDANGMSSEIGPDKDRPGGALANIAYFGTSRGGGTVPDPVGALEAEVPVLVRFIGEAVDKAFGS